MKAVEFIKAIKSNSKYNKKDEWYLIINSIKGLKYNKVILEKIAKVLLSENLRDKDINIILNNF
ncbi:MAG: ribosomal protein L20A (L18A) [Sulfurimonas sp.]|jgi:ribosomal protein L20A (L18A)